MSRQLCTGNICISPKYTKNIHKIYNPDSRLHSKPMICELYIVLRCIFSYFVTCVFAWHWFRIKSGQVQGYLLCCFLFIYSVRPFQPQIAEKNIKLINVHTIFSQIPQNATFYDFLGCWFMICAALLACLDVMDSKVFSRPFMDLWLFGLLKNVCSLNLNDT